MEYFILVGHQPVAVSSMMEWARWFEHADRRVALTFTEDLEISTVFLGANHGWGDVVLLFETMVFAKDPDDKRDLPMDRYSTWDEAVAGHNAIVHEMTVQEKSPPV